MTTPAAGPRSDRAFQRAVVGVDGSPGALHALSWASTRVGDDGLHVVHAVNPAAELAMASIQMDWTAIRDRAQRQLATEWTESARSFGRIPTTHVIDDDPADALLRAAQRFGASAIIVGAHGTGGRFVGSVLRKLLRETTVPLVVIHARDHVPLEVPPRPVVVGIGYGKSTESTAMWAADIADRTARPLHLLHVVSNRPFFPKDSPIEALGSHLGADVAVDWAKDLLGQLSDTISATYPAVNVEKVVCRGSATRGILDNSDGAELVVLGRRPLTSLVSPRISRILSRGRCPTAVVPSCVT